MLALLFIGQVKVAPIDFKLTVDGVQRTAVVYAAKKGDKPAPVVFVFHGFTGNARQAAFSYRVHEAWPEATVVYPQGLEVQLLGTKGPGWQIAPKTLGSRDEKFFDALLGKLKTDIPYDTKRVYTCGMSNGAIFSYTLLTTRSAVLAAAGPVAGIAMPGFRGAPAKPVIIIHGKADTLLKMDNAIVARDNAISNNKCSKTTKEWQPGYVLYPGAKPGVDVVWHEHDGGHIWPKDASASLVKFFKQHSL